MVNLNKRIEKDEKEILDKEFYKKKYEKILKEKESSEKEKTSGFKSPSDVQDKITQNTEDNKSFKKSPTKINLKILNDRKKSRKTKDKYESNENIYFLKFLS